MEGVDPTRPKINAIGGIYYKSKKDGNYYLVLKSGKKIEITGEEYLDAIIEIVAAANLIKPDSNESQAEPKREIKEIQ